MIISGKSPHHQFKLSVFAEDDYVEENKDLLIDWFIYSNRFPLTIDMGAYKDKDEQIDKKLIDWAIPDETETVASEKLPVYIIHVENAEQFKKVLSEFDWLPAQNEMMFLTDCNEAVVLTERKVHVKSHYTVLGTEIQLTSKECSVIIVQPDGQGMDVVTTVHSLSSAEGIRASIPSNCTVQQWNDEVLIPFG